MSQYEVCRAIRRFGTYSGARYLRNRGVPFETTYRACFGRDPRVLGLC